MVQGQRTNFDSMTRSLPLLFLAAAAAEIASIIWVGKLIGVVPTLLLMLLGGVLGIRLIKSAGLSVAAALRSPVQSAAPLKALGGQAAARTASGVLFLLPGFFSDVLGLLLFLPPVRQWIGSRFRVETYSIRPTEERRFDRVIEAEAVEITAEVDPPDQRTR
jgi:UPF0716 protein FxsA